MTRDGGLLDSGDLAFRLDGELYIAGRSKDLIIKGGRNLVPQEIEEVVADVPASAAAAWSRSACRTRRSAPRAWWWWPRRASRTRPRRDALAAAVIERVATAVGVPPDVVELVAPGAVPKTSCGKIQRQATRQLYLRRRPRRGRAHGAGRPRAR